MTTSTDRQPTKRISLRDLSKTDIPIVLVKNYSILEEFIIESGNNQHNYYNIPDAVKPGMPIDSVSKIKYISRMKLGRTSQLPKRHYIESLFIRNEILACKQMAMSRVGLTREYRKEFQGETKNHYARFGDLVRRYRSEYNTLKLYTDQPPLILFSFNYNPRGLITHTSRYTALLSFQYCKRLLKKANFADPRFFTKEEIDKYRRYEKLGWTVPDQTIIDKIERQIGKPLYDSIYFPSGYTKEHDPI